VKRMTRERITNERMDERNRVDVDGGTVW